MNRNELAKELSVPPWDIDDWLLMGCPAKKIRMNWEFNIEHVKIWLKTEKIKMKPIKPQHLPVKSGFDQRWFGGRCPICTDSGFSGEKAGRLYNIGEILEDEWHLRRVGIPCGHSQNINPMGTFLPTGQSSKKGGIEMAGDGKTILNGRQAAPEVKKDKIAALKKRIMEGTYQVKAEDIASKFLKEFLLKILLSQNSATAGGRSYNITSLPSCHRGFPLA